MIKEPLLKMTKFRKRIGLLQTKKDLYASDRDTMEIHAYQLEAFNTIWRMACSKSAFYQDWSRKHGLPSTIGSLRELAHFPILTKEDIRRDRDLIFRGLPKHRVISTGGSTGEPTPFPTRDSEKDWEYANTYLGKGWWGIEPLDPILMYWGHSHLFGVGPMKRVNKAKRDLGDWLINTQRENAYDMTPETISRYCENLKGKNPKAIIGYTSCLFQLAKFILENSVSIGDKSRLMAVIPTSETVSSHDIDILQRAFGAPVAIEYGMAETGVIAYSRTTPEKLQVFWDSFIVQSGGDGGLILTTLNDRLFPLIRYRTDDVAVTESQDTDSAMTLKSVQGRSKESVSVAAVSGEKLNLSGILLVHILKGFPGILGINFKQLAESRVEIRLASDSPIDMSAAKHHFFQHLHRDHPEADSKQFEFLQVGKTEKTVAGKEKILC